MATQAKTPQQEAPERLVERGRRESEEARRQLGEDPQEAFFTFVRETYDYESVLALYRAMIELGPGWLDDDADVESKAP